MEKSSPMMKQSSGNNSKQEHLHGEEFNDQMKVGVLSNETIKIITESHA